jgi:hypothetical protein
MVPNLDSLWASELLSIELDVRRLSAVFSFRVIDRSEARQSDPWSNGGVDFGNVSAAVLANHGIALGEPEAPPTMSEVTAAAVASQAVRGAAVLESRYVHCRMVSKHRPSSKTAGRSRLIQAASASPSAPLCRPTHSSWSIQLAARSCFTKSARHRMTLRLLPPDPRLGRA